MRALRLVGLAHAKLAPLDLEVGPGELVALVGPSGSGKSLALRMVAGFERARAGQVWIDGRDVTHAAPTQRDLAVVFPDQPLFAHLSVFENLAFALRVRKVAEPEITGRVSAAAASVGVAHLLERAPRHLSGGERQRIAVARALARAPRVILFDEPLANLDRPARHALLADLCAILHRSSTASVYVTHDAAEAALLADRVVTLHSGAVHQAA